METQNLVISFNYSWFLAKNLAYAECPIMKFHYRNSSIADLLTSSHPQMSASHLLGLQGPQHDLSYTIVNYIGSSCNSHKYLNYQKSLKFPFYSFFRINLPGRYYELNVHFGIFVGGMGNFNEIFLGNRENFRGCLDSVFFNGRDVLSQAKVSIPNII